jgi:hypothetical protein
MNNEQTRTLKGLIVCDLKTAIQICKEALHSRGYHSLLFGEASLVCFKNDPQTNSNTKAVVKFQRQHSLITYTVDLSSESANSSDVRLSRQLVDLEAAINDHIHTRINGAFDYTSSRYVTGPSALCWT